MERMLWGSMAGVLLLATAGPGVAQTPVVSKPGEVTVYPGRARVERLAAVEAGTQRWVLTCLPAGLDVQSLDVKLSDPGAQVGDVAVRTLSRDEAGCVDRALEDRIVALEDRRAQWQAEAEGLNLALAFLKSGQDQAQPQRVPDAKTLRELGAVVRQDAREAHARLHTIRREQETLDGQLKALRAQRQRQGENLATVRQVTVTVSSPRPTGLRLVYQVPGPGWSPGYRAHLDTQRQRLQLTRTAQVAQSSGEDWTGVRMRLSTVQPTQRLGMSRVHGWRLFYDPIVPPQPTAAEGARAGLRMAAPVPAPAPAPAPSFEEPTVRFDPSVFAGLHGTEFVLPQPVSVSADGQPVTLQLDRQELPVKTVTRLHLGVDRHGWLMAEFERPAGDWPPGSVVTSRDGAYLGVAPWPSSAERVMELGMGTDLGVVALPLPGLDERGSSGLTGARLTRRLERGVEVENRHDRPVTVEVLEPYPVSRHEEVRVELAFEPPVTDMNRPETPELARWRFTLQPGERRTLQARYLISWPREGRLRD